MLEQQRRWDAMVRRRITTHITIDHGLECGKEYPQITVRQTSDFDACSCSSYSSSMRSNSVLKGGHRA